VVAETAGSRQIEALSQFRQARRRAQLERLLARVGGAPADLLSYEDVRQMLRGQDTARRTLREIPLDAIVGSVGRYGDFTRQFLPLREADQARWARVAVQMDSLTGLPPIEVYQIGDAYFVQDGNHRVSVARQLGATSIEAYVTEVETKVPLSPDDDPDDLILKAEYAEFLEQTQLDRTRPGADLRVTAPGRHAEALEQIALHGLRRNPGQGRAAVTPEAAAGWYDHDFLPVVALIDDLALLDAFPGRTHLDLYAWIVRHRARLREMLEWDVGLKAAAADLVERREVDRPRSDTLFSRILVPVSGAEVGWYALAQALLVAQREGGQILGLHVVSSEAEGHSPEVAAIRAEFLGRCRAAGVPAQMAVAAGRVAPVIAERARYADLLVLRLVYPPPPSPIARLSSGFRAVIQRTTCPALVVPRMAYPLERLLVAYDGSPRSHMALTLAAYLAERWQAALTVATVQGAGVDPDACLAEAGRYLEGRSLPVAYRGAAGPVEDALLGVAEQQRCDLLIMGSYAAAGWRDLVTASTVDAMLRRARLPLLICR
jgi:nucleotide-binding universal stress UspA family protein